MQKEVLKHNCCCRSHLHLSSRPLLLPAVCAPALRIVSAALRSTVQRVLHLLRRRPAQHCVGDAIQARLVSLARLLLSCLLQGLKLPVGLRSVS